MDIHSYRVATTDGNGTRVDAEMVVNFDDRVEFRTEGKTVAFFMKHSLVSFALKTTAKAPTEPEA